MKLLLLGLDVIGFVGILTSAVAACLVSSFARLTLNYLLKMLEGIGKFLRLAKSRMPVSITQTTKNQTDWIVIKIAEFSILIGKKNQVKSEQESL